MHSSTPFARTNHISRIDVTVFRVGANILLEYISLAAWRKALVEWRAGCLFCCVNGRVYMHCIVALVDGVSATPVRVWFSQNKYFRPRTWVSTTARMHYSLGLRPETVTYTYSMYTLSGRSPGCFPSLIPPPPFSFFPPRPLDDGR